MWPESFHFDFFPLSSHFGRQKKIVFFMEWRTKRNVAVSLPLSTEKEKKKVCYHFFVVVVVVAKQEKK